MGYYTKYDLSVTTDVKDINIKELKNKIVIDLSQILYGEPPHIDSWEFSDLLEEEMKWYDFEKDMTSLSKKYPDVLFLLEGKGEESEDIWKAYFKDGYAQIVRARMVFDNFSVEEFKARIRDEKIKSILPIKK